MPSEDPRTRTAERCSRHPARSAVARCDECGRPLCLPCAIPVRGRVLGSECLPEHRAGDQDRGADVRGLALTRERIVTGASFALALVATVVPWTRFGVGSSAFGAWVSGPRWATLSAVAAALGFGTWIVQQVRGRPLRPLDIALTVLGGLVAAGALLAITRPPAFTRTWIGPWIALVAGVTACVASAASLTRTYGLEERHV